MRYLNVRWISSSDGSTKALRVNNVKENITQEEIMAFMEKVATSQLLKTSKGSPVDTVDSATVVNTDSTQIFNFVQ
ncbi:MAG: hypothetical protein C0176_03050 [Mesoaciditoga sp.]|uniref:DUF2922 domain-containing protein n=1 Tax=Athalassotoga sp. TaxID=2022597 RepID=UPI000CA9774A|nr:MAG: hypothetical protein C0176_03050 [Mesoaciditoga sp.]HEU24275.1 DUF2922 domain-containing protein [Mesoaciditoga lauensis]